jgi:hypothetical protein
VFELMDLTRQEKFMTDDFHGYELARKASQKRSVTITGLHMNEIEILYYATVETLVQTSYIVH